jgi:hypothetical protein
VEENMLTIRKEQFRVFEEIEKKKFDDHMVRHLNNFFPEKCAELKEEGMRASIEKAVSKTRNLGLKMEYDIERFLNHMYALGFDFDTSPNYPWVKEILSDPDVDPSELMDILSERSRQELEEKKLKKGQ